MLEGRFDGVKGFDVGEFLDDRHRFTHAEYIPPAATWIDPEKEANAFAQLLKLRLITREEIVAQRGGRFYQVVNKLAEEKAFTTDAGLSLPENADDLSQLRELLKQFIANKQGEIANVIANSTDMGELMTTLGIPLRKDYNAPLLPIVVPDGPLASGEPIKDSAGDIVGGGVMPSPIPQPAAPAPFGASASKVSPPAPLRSVTLAQADAPKYRTAKDDTFSCGTCSNAVAGHCKLYNFDWTPGKVCNSWTAAPVVDSAPSAKAFPPSIPDGERGIERDFQPDASTAPLA